MSLLMSRAGSKGLGIRVLKNGQMGYAYTSDFSSDSVHKSTEAALALAEVADGDEHRHLPEPQTIPDVDLQIYDEAIANLPTEAKVDFALKVEESALKADPRVVMTNRASYVDSIATVYLTNSKGFSGSYDSTFAASFVSAMAAAKVLS